MIYFRKILQYELSPASDDVFEYLDGVTSQRIDPPSLNPKTFFVDSGVVFCSKLRRAKECLCVAGEVILLEAAGINEIPFSLISICSKDEWEREKSVIVRKRFKEAFIADTLPISRKQIFDEIISVLRQCEIIYEIGDITILSHSFRMKIIEAYIKSKGAIVSRPELIHDYLFDGEKTYDFGSGFDFDKLVLVENLINKKYCTP